MITKFFDSKMPSKSIEFIPRENGFCISSETENTIIEIELGQQDLFDLIGQLLRMQSQMRKGGNDGRE